MCTPPIASLSLRSGKTESINKEIETETATATATARKRGKKSEAIIQLESSVSSVWLLALAQI